MLKKQITFENFDGETTTETHYFNLSKPEIIEMQVEDNIGFAKILQNILDTNDSQEMVKQFKRIILMAYGVKSEDGRRFIKTEQLKEEFSQTEAYNVLFMEMVEDDKAAIAFINGVLPKDIQDEITKANLKEKTADALGTKTPPQPPTQ